MSFLQRMFIIIIRKIEMGCGAVCGIQQPSSNKYAIYSQANILQLIPKIKICKPLLTDGALRRFAEVAVLPNNQYLLKVGERIGADEEIQPPIMQKWRIIVYGLDKDEETYKQCLSFQVRNEKQQVTNSQKMINNSAIIQNKSYHELKPNTQYHECFTQIEKDLNRTFEFKQEKKKIFENILKRISNYFPSMGYTQGVNFVVGYLLIIGYSESDAFWIFSHLALHQRYLILGLYEDDFPLAYIYTCIFKNMLKRLDLQLHDHLFGRLMLDQSIWIFKWFITFYIYSFPFNTVKYIWNLVIELGGIALVYYALALVIHIRSYLLQIDDQCDISEFLQGLKEVGRFNQLVKINQVILKVYQMKLVAQDFDGINKLKPSFYREYYERLLLIVQASQAVNKDGNQQQQTQQTQICSQSLARLVRGWYEKIMRQRAQFKQNSVEKERKTFLPQILKNEYLDLEKSIHILEQKIIQNESIKISKQTPRANDNFFGDLIHDVPFDITLTDGIHRQPQVSDMQYRSKNLTKMSYDMEEEINQVDEESDSHQDIDDNSCQNIQPNRPRQSIIVQEDILGQIKNQSPNTNFALKLNTIVGQADTRRKAKESNVKANNIKIGQDKRTGLALAAQNILCNLSVTHSHYSSSSSKNASIKPRKHKENNLFRPNKNNKVRTEQVSQPSVDPSSSRDSSIDHHTDKESFSGMTHRQESKDRPSLILNDRRTQQEFMISSQGPEKLTNTLNPSKQLASEIEIFRGDNLFKKKNKVRNSNVISINQNMGKSTHQLQSIESYSKRTITINQRNKNSPSCHQQESIDAILYTLSSRKNSQQHQQYQKDIDAMIYEIQSIK